jgi:hypothetical protein
LQKVFFPLFFVDCLLSFFLWVVFIHALIYLVLLIDGFLSLIFFIWGFSLVRVGCASFGLSLAFSFVFCVMVLAVDFYLIFYSI